jgi:hypothetical protein
VVVLKQEARGERVEEGARASEEGKWGVRGKGGNQPLLSDHGGVW